MHVTKCTHTREEVSEDQLGHIDTMLLMDYHRDACSVIPNTQSPVLLIIQTEYDVRPLRLELGEMDSILHVETGFHRHCPKACGKQKVVVFTSYLVDLHFEGVHGGISLLVIGSIDDNLIENLVQAWHLKSKKEKNKL